MKTKVVKKTLYISLKISKTKYAILHENLEEMLCKTVAIQRKMT